jgi:hypothetical protein
LRFEKTAESFSSFGRAALRLYRPVVQGDASRVRVRHHAFMSNGSEGKDVLSSLPRSRPQRRSAKREGANAGKPKAAPGRPAKPKAPAPSAGKPKPRPASKAEPRPQAKPKVSGATRPSAATRRAREETVKPPAAEPVAPADRDLIATTVQAAGELARIGLTVGSQIVREAARRLPKP